MRTPGRPKMNASRMREIVGLVLLGMQLILCSRGISVKLHKRECQRPYQNVQSKGNGSRQHHGADKVHKLRLIVSPHIYEPGVLHQLTTTNCIEKQKVPHKSRTNKSSNKLCTVELIHLRRWESSVLNVSGTIVLHTAWGQNLRWAKVSRKLTCTHERKDHIHHLAAREGL